MHSCGFDSIPSDLGVLLLHEAVAADGAGELADTTLVAAMKGGFSGGTIDSMRAQVEAVQAEKSLRRIVVDPYALSPRPGRRARPRRRAGPRRRCSQTTSSAGGSGRS